MNRWAARIIGIVLILIFLIVFVQMYKTLVRLQEQQGVIKSSSLQVVESSRKRCARVNGTLLDDLTTRRLDDSIPTTCKMS